MTFLYFKELVVLLMLISAASVTATGQHPTLQNCGLQQLRCSLCALMELNNFCNSFICYSSLIGGTLLVKHCLDHKWVKINLLHFLSIDIYDLVGDQSTDHFKCKVVKEMDQNKTETWRTKLSYPRSSEEEIFESQGWVGI